MSSLSNIPSIINPSETPTLSSSSKRKREETPSRENELIREFREIKSKSSLITPTLCPDLFKTALGTMSKNRYSDVLPNEATRVTVEGVPGFYYNGNWVECGKTRVIASQGPRREDLKDFFTLLKGAQVSTIVNLTNSIEGGKEKCTVYWDPDGQNEVIFKAENSSEQIVKRTLKLQATEESNPIVIFHLENWPDFGVVNENTLATLIKTVTQCMQSTSGTLLVHCSAGIGRTGTFLAAYSGLQQIQEGENPRLKDIVSSLRNPKTGRVGLVQTQEQYILAHDTIETLKT